MRFTQTQERLHFQSDKLHSHYRDHLPNWGRSEDVERDFFGKTEFGRIPDVPTCIESETSGKNFGIE